MWWTFLLRHLGSLLQMAPLLIQEGSSRTVQINDPSWRIAVAATTAAQGGSRTPGTPQGSIGRLRRTFGNGLILHQHRGKRLVSYLFSYTSWKGSIRTFFLRLFSVA